MDLSKLSDEELRAIVAQGRAKKQPAHNPTDDMSGWDTFLSGIGKVGYDTARGLGNIVTDIAPSAAKFGFATRADTDEANKRDAALMDTPSGFGGNILGNLLPAILMPGSTLPRALASGAGMGFIQPVGTKDSRTENTAVGGGFGAAVPAGLAAFRGVRAVAEPAMKPQVTAARMLDQFANDPQAMRLAARSAPELVPGSKPTLAQAVQQPGISSLERGAFNQPGPMQEAMSARMIEQNAARVAAMDDLSGAGGKLDFYKTNREMVANELYSRAFAEMPEDSKWIKGEVSKLMQRPAFVAALKDAQELALNSGIKVSPKNPENATQLLHFTKMSLDDEIEAAVRAGNGNKSRALIDTRDKLVSLMESKGFAPSYREARDTYKQMSGPINEMEIAGDLRKKLVPALQADVEAPTQLNANNFAAEMQRHGEDIGRVFSPEGKGKLEGVFQDLQRKARAEALGKANGSPTAQYLTTQNLMRQIAGPLGLPQGFMEKTGNTLMSLPGVGPAMQWGAKGIEQRLQQEVGNLLLNPATAADALDLLKRQSALSRNAGRLLPHAAGGLSATGLFANRN